MSRAKKTDCSFEEAVTQLESIVKQLEKGDLPLDEALTCFQEGVALSQFCFKQLDTAERQMDKVIQELNGAIIKKPLAIQEDME